MESGRVAGSAAGRCRKPALPRRLHGLEVYIFGGETNRASLAMPASSTR